jgi:glycyl-tRNA synthetase beta chain
VVRARRKPGRATADVLAEAIPAIIRAFPWPKSQRWGAVDQHRSLALGAPAAGHRRAAGRDMVSCEVAGVLSGRTTLGHRFHSSGRCYHRQRPLTYAEELRAAFVIVDQERRKQIIESRAKAAAEAGLTLIEDEGLVAENAGLTEWPVPLLGRILTLRFLRFRPKLSS